MANLILSPKYKDFLKHVVNERAKADYLEGTTFAGKTTVGAYAFVMRIAGSGSNKPSVIAGLDLGTIEKNIINSDMGLLDLFGGLLTYNGNGTGTIKLPHMVLRTSRGSKLIYIAGYDDKARWKKMLGSQMYGLFIDEINIADMEFIREATMRADYVMATLNPDSPDLPVYKEYINRSRPLARYGTDAPKEISEALTEPHNPGWTHWFFGFGHNPALTDEKREQIISSVPVGTKLYKNKIQGLRGRATGLVFDLQKEHIVKPDYKFTHFSCGVDTSYSRQSDDTFAFIFLGITTDRKCVILAEREYNNKDLKEPITPSDIPPLLISFLEECRKEWGFGRNVFIDSADQGTILECMKYKKRTGSPYMFQGAWKKTGIIDRINLQAGWMAHGDYLISYACKSYQRELNAYSWQEKKDMPEDGNDHLINAAQYAWLPFKDKIGGIA